MTSIIVQKFSGIAPRVDTKQLGENMAQVAEDSYLDQSDLRPMPGLVDSGATASSSLWKSMYLYRGLSWIGSDNLVEYAEAPVLNDQFARLVVTDRTLYPRVYTLGTYYRLGLPAPDTAGTATPTQAPTGPDAVDAETISYVMTYVDSFGNEGPPSSPTASVDRVRDTDVNLTGLPTAPAGNYNFGGGSLVRIYRSNAGSEATAYQFCKEVALGTASTVDSVPGSSLQEVLPSATWTAAPDDDTALWVEPMRNVVNMPNGILAGVTNKTLVFNEPFLLHAWPTDYAITFDEVIVNIVSIAAGLLVVTATQPYLVSGVHPQSMAVQPLDIMQGCISERSLVDMGEYAMYSSPDGLVAVYGTDAELVTKELITRDQWRSRFEPESIQGFTWENKYLAFFDDGGVGLGGIMFDPKEGAKALVELSQYHDAGYYDAEQDQLWVKNQLSTTLYHFGRNFASPYSYTWRSKRFVTPKPVSFASIRVEVEDADYSDITIKIYGDGVLRDTIVCSTLGLDYTTPYTRLAAGYRCKTWEIEITGSSTVTYLGLFESLSEAI